MEKLKIAPDSTFMFGIKKGEKNLNIIDRYK